MSEEQIRFLVESYYDIQKLRVETFNRIVAYVQNNLDKFTSQRKVENQKTNASQTLPENRRGSAPKPSKIVYEILRGKIRVPSDIKDLVWYHDSLFATEKELRKKLNGWSRTHPIRRAFCDKVRGIGGVLSSGLIAWIHPISRFPTISKLWGFAGLSATHYESECKEGHKFITVSKPERCWVRVGKKRKPCNAELVRSVFVNSPPKKKAGYVLFVNLKLKTLCWKVATSFEKQKPKKSFYRRLYDRQKEYYHNRPDLKEEIPKHIQLMTLRYVEKRFLADMWVKWRKLEGLPVTKPYAIDILRKGEYEEWKPDVGT